jgi:hypothetical protein
VSRRDLGHLLRNTIEVTFDRNKVTPAWVTLAQQRDEDQDTLSLPKALADVLISWDVLNDDGTPFEPTPENIAVLSYPAQSDLLRRIMEAAVPSRAEGNASPEPSSIPPSGSEAPAVTPPNGQVTSALPELSASPSPT